MPKIGNIVKIAVIAVLAVAAVAHIAQARKLVFGPMAAGIE